MDKTIFPPNVPIDESRISKIERILSRTMRKSRKSVSVTIPPIPLFMYTMGDTITGTIMRGIIFKGNIVRGIAIFNKKPPESVHVDIAISTDGIGMAKTYILEKKKEVFDIGINTQDGSLLKVSIKDTTLEDSKKLTEMSLSLLWIPHVSLHRIHKIAISELEKSAHDLLEE